MEKNKKIMFKKSLICVLLLVFMNGCFLEVLQRENEEQLLGDEKWYVYKFVLKNGREFEPIWEGVQSSMIFDIDENRIFGVSVCNNYFASFTLKGKKLKMSDSGSSRRMCSPAESMSYEFFFTRGLNGDFVIHRKGKFMEIKGKEMTYYLKPAE